MRYMIIFATLIFLLVSTPTFSQHITQKELLAKSNAYYQATPCIYVVASVKIKASIADDTATVIENCFIDRQKSNKLFLLPNDDGIFIHQSNQYFFFHLSNQFRKVPNSDRKYTIYNTRYKYYPFVETENFFSGLERQKLAVVERDSSYILTNLSGVYEFNKNNFTVKKITHVEYDIANKGTYFREIRFDYPTIPVNDIYAEINHAIDVISSKENEKEIRTNNPKPTSIDRAQLNDAVTKANRTANIEGKTILLDFFYQACLPCIKSYPIMNSFFKCSNAKFTVIGIDPRLSDTSGIDKHIERYNIQYPVVTGKVAEKLAQTFEVTGYPTFILVDPNGKIEVYRFGHSTGFFNMVRRKYFPNCP